MRKIITHFKVVLTLLLPVTVSAQQIQWQSCMASQFNHWFGEEKPSPDLLCGYL
ncbi:alpha/beta hydrolase, partial [Escherichia coli]|nr:alpha/beta hydrolase [Escherichia coli]MCM5129960.1 alpha/beta hydrolase [Escherichia coli]